MFYDVLFGCKDIGVGMLDGMMIFVCDLVDVLIVLLLGFIVLLIVMIMYDE